MSPRVLPLVVSLALISVSIGARPAHAAPILLTGLSDSGLTATVDNYTLVNNVFAFDLMNTSPGFIMTNFGGGANGLTHVQLPFVLQTDVPTALVPTNRWLFVQPPGPNPNFPTTPQPPDWALFITQNPNVLGLPSGQTFHFALTLDQTSGLSAFQIANGLLVRMRNDPVVNATSLTDVVGTYPHTAAVPEPATMTLVGLGLIARRLSRRRGHG